MGGEIGGETLQGKKNDGDGSRGEVVLCNKGEQEVSHAISYYIDTSFLCNFTSRCSTNKIL